MASTSRYHIIFTDVGGVLATNGWDTDVRLRTAARFRIEKKEMESRHHLVFDSYERGNLSIEEYLHWTVFFKPRPFSMEEVRQFIYDQGKLLPGTSDMLRRVKAANGVKMGIISNEGGGLTEDRARKFKLRELADFMLFSCTVHMRKPDPEIWRLALALAQATPKEAIYIDDRDLFVEAAAALGFTAHQHTSTQETEAWLGSVGLRAG